MAAVFDVYWDYGATPTGETLTNLRFNEADDNDQDTGNPCVIPGAGTEYSYWKHVYLRCTTAPSVQCNNFKFYSDGAAMDTGTLIKIATNTVANDTDYDQADGTDEMVRQRMTEYPFIELLQLKNRDDRNFGSKARALNTGYRQIYKNDYRFIGILDADVSFEPSYFENIINRFDENNKLGIAGGVIVDIGDGQFLKKHRNLSSVSGAIQFFRRKCFEDIGGYLPLSAGGIDAAAEIMARMHGWQVASFPDLEVQHYRATGSEGKSICRARFLGGVMPVDSVLKLRVRIQRHERPTNDF